MLGIPGQQNFPQALVKELTNRVNTWLLPIYGYSEDEELSRVAEAALPGEQGGACMA